MKRMGKGWGRLLTAHKRVSGLKSTIPEIGRSGTDRSPTQRAASAAPALR